MNVTRHQDWFLAMVAICGLVNSACGVPKNEDVKAAFLKENPTFIVTQVGSGEGDGDTMYKHIRYRATGSSVECEVVWGYQKAEPTWRLFHKGEPGLSGTVCEGA